MKTTSLKTIYFTKDELKAAMIGYLAAQGEKTLSQFLVKSACVMEWSRDTEELILSMSGD
ncbi:MAG: hypothetical protein CMB80_34000 [Flammeovirgaceae bacterium]|nr:hypothetical protein [Flammeovirgaceae bacterium]|tara:strand:- start:145 stop:324 length:180 start_codon:yes stop_codon:yes gene_type:complete